MVDHHGAGRPECGYADDPVRLGTLAGYESQQRVGIGRTGTNSAATFVARRGRRRCFCIFPISWHRETRTFSRLRLPKNVPANRIPAFLIDEDSQWSELQNRLQDAYTFGAPLLSEDLETWTTAFTDLDEDGDGTVWDNELMALADGNADLTVQIEMPGVDFAAEHRGRISIVPNGGSTTDDDGVGTQDSVTMAH